MAQDPGPKAPMVGIQCCVNISVALSESSQIGKGLRQADVCLAFTKNDGLRRVVTMHLPDCNFLELKVSTKDSIDSNCVWQYVPLRIDVQGNSE